MKSERFGQATPTRSTRYEGRKEGTPILLKIIKKKIIIIK